jgi:hypothetical protein
MLDRLVWVGLNGYGWFLAKQAVPAIAIKPNPNKNAPSLCTWGISVLDLGRENYVDFNGSTVGYGSLDNPSSIS